MCYMMMGNFAKVVNQELKEMGSIVMLKKVLEDTDDEEIKAVGRKVGVWPLGVCACRCHFHRLRRVVTGERQPGRRRFKRIDRNFFGA